MAVAFLGVASHRRCHCFAVLIATMCWPDTGELHQRVFGDSYEFTMLPEPLDEEAAEYINCASSVAPGTG